MTDAERLIRLIKWLETIYADVQQLLLDDHLFWEFQKIVEHNDEFLKASGLFTRFIATGYIRSAAIGVRRQAKSDKDSVSVVRFLCEVRDYPQIVSRQHYVALYDGTESRRVEIGQRDFDRIAGKGGSHVPSALAEQQIRDVRDAVEKIEHYVDRRIAHHDKRDLARPVPTFSELTEALRTLERIVILYWRLLKGPSMSTVLPTIVYDWKDIFRFAWERQP